MKVLKVAVVTILGFILGAVLAGLGGITSARSILFKESERSIEEYWKETKLDRSQVSEFVSNDKCNANSLYFRACVNAVVQSAISMGARFDFSVNFESSDLDFVLVKDQKAIDLEELNEKELLQSYLSTVNEQLWDFDKMTESLLEFEKETNKELVAAELINSFLSAYLDPHSYIIPSEYYSEVGSKIERSKYFVGINYDKRNGKVIVTKVSKNSDAETAGLKPGDQILEINNEEVAHKSFADISKLLKDESKETINFKVIQNSKIANFVMKRSYRNLSHVQGDTIGEKSDIGLITFSKFSRFSCIEIKKAIEGYKRIGVRGIILDLRDNPGGQLDEAVCIAGLLLGPGKTAYYVEYFGSDRLSEVVLTEQPQIYDGPLTVLINQGSASSAELLSGALQDYKRAVIIGRPSFGKGTFQEPEEWQGRRDITYFKTRGFYLLPSQLSPQGVGIQPDILLPKKEFEEREANYFVNPISHKIKKHLSVTNDNYLAGAKIHSECVRSTPKEELKSNDGLLAALDLINCSEKIKNQNKKDKVADKR